jgi:hypothetical protein
LPHCRLDAERLFRSQGKDRKLAPKFLAAAEPIGDFLFNPTEDREGQREELNMKKVAIGVAALAIGALAAPTIGSSAELRGGGSAARVSAGTAGPSAGAAVRGTAMAPSIHGNAMAPSTFQSSQNPVVKGPNTALTSSGQQWASGDWHHHHGHDHDRHHHNFIGFVPFGYDYDDYAAYDTCWQTVWTPAGYQREYVCNGPYAAYGPDYGPGFYASTY